MIEGRHIGGDAEQQESKLVEKPTVNEENEKKTKESKKEVEPSTETAKIDKDKKGRSAKTCKPVPQRRCKTQKHLHRVIGPLGLIFFRLCQKQTGGTLFQQDLAEWGIEKEK